MPDSAPPNPLKIKAWILDKNGNSIGPGELITTITGLFVFKTASTKSFPLCQASKLYLSPLERSKVMYCSPESAFKKTMHKSAFCAIFFAVSISSSPT